MKKIILIFCLIAGNQGFSALADQELIDKYVTAALSMPEKIEVENSKWSCKHLFKGDSYKKGVGKKREEAEVEMQLLCIKQQCLDLQGAVQASVENLLSQKESDFRELLEFMGIGAEEAEKLLKARNIYSKEKATPLTCLNSAHFRMSAFDLCFSSPIECKEN